jgi:4-hydroxyphenylpyruvate dioxygenase
VTHGSSICAIALRVDDASAAVERAVSLLDQPFRQAVGPGELDIPAVRGVAGSLVYFVDGKSGLDRLWDVDFDAVNGGAQSTDAGLVTVDHLSQTMRYEEMLTWLLFYNSLFDVVQTRRRRSSTRVAWCRAKRSRRRPGRFASSSTLRRVTRLFRRASCQKLWGWRAACRLATDDIFATVEGLCRNGVELLPIPENYYDDLETRADLSDDEIARMKRLNILYDREGEAEFFQAYTKALLDGGFFFEIVQRRGYRGYGAVNAPIRLAAQTRLATRPLPPAL